MSSVESRAKLMQAMKKLLADWEQVRNDWRDDNCHQFDKKYIAPLESSTRAAAQAMERMESMLAAAQHDCEDSTDY